MDFIRSHRLAFLFLLNIMTALALLGALYLAGLDPAVIGRLHTRYWNYAIPAAVSELDYGLGGYRAYVSVLMHFINNSAQQATLDTANQLIVSAQTLKDVAASGIYLFPGDEKGLQDFVALAFRLFGTKIESLSALYLMVVAFAVLLHAVNFARQPALQAVQLVALSAILATAPALRITSELGSLLNPRALGLLALPATISLMCAAIVGQIRLWRLLILALQVAIVAFVVHVRNAEVWQLAAPVILAVGLAVWRGKPSAGDSGITRKSQAWTSASVVAAVCGVFFLSQLVAQSGSIQNTFRPSSCKKSSGTMSASDFPSAPVSAKSIILN